MRCICIGRAAAGSRSEKNLYCSSLMVEFCGQEGDNSIFWDSHQVTLGLGLVKFSIHIAQKFLQISSKAVFYCLIFAKVGTDPSQENV